VGKPSGFPTGPFPPTRSLASSYAQGRAKPFFPALVVGCARISGSSIDRTTFEYFLRTFPHSRVRHLMHSLTLFRFSCERPIRHNRRSMIVRPAIHHRPSIALARIVIPTRSTPSHTRGNKIAASPRAACTSRATLTQWDIPSCDGAVPYGHGASECGGRYLENFTYQQGSGAVCAVSRRCQAPPVSRDGREKNRSLWGLRFRNVFRCGDGRG
jgi:hypothetical protein